jgi:hypothetical protein
VAGLLRGHWLAGRISDEELDGRLGAALAARDDRQLFTAVNGLPFSSSAPAPALAQSNGSATASLVLGIVGLCVLLLSFGFFSVLTLPISATAWGLGRSARRSATGSESWRSSARAGEVMGIVGTSLSFLLMAGCAAVIAL